ncbi:replication initiation protein [Tortoise microvirus 32]|nr:replication initiation protein [Tortoise microvirus 32]
MASCLTPYIVKHNGDEQPVPCGKCPACMKRRISGWSFRLMQEYKRCHSAHFITLTYDTKHVPITDKGFMALSKRDVQLFFKRLRKAHTKEQLSDNPIKYYVAGEYGGRTNRPHYHIILFNAVLELIQPAWNLGSVHYGEVNEASVGYTLKYMCKPARIPLHANDDRQPEFSLMSKGLAATT